MECNQEKTRMAATYLSLIVSTSENAFTILTAGYRHHTGIETTQLHLL